MNKIVTLKHNQGMYFSVAKKDERVDSSGAGSPKSIELMWAVRVL